MGFLFFLELLKLRFARGLRCHPDCTVSLSAALNCMLFIFRQEISIRRMPLCALKELRNH